MANEVQREEEELLEEAEAAALYEEMGLEGEWADEELGVLGPGVGGEGGGEEDSAEGGETKREPLRVSFGTDRDNGR